jgi:hypothetical protein
MMPPDSTTPSAPNKTKSIFSMAYATAESRMKVVGMPSASNSLATSML